MEIVIQPDGSFLVPRGNSQENQFVKELFTDIVEQDEFSALEDFLAVSENFEQIFGLSGLCG